MGLNLENEEDQGYQSEPEIAQTVLEPIEEKPQPVVKIGRKRKREADSKKYDECGNRIPNKITNCPHTDRTFYAKGMCQNCYHKKGRQKPAACCPDKALYANGLCHNCYMKDYSRKARSQKKVQKSSLELSASATGTDKVDDERK